MAILRGNMGKYFSAVDSRVIRSLNLSAAALGVLVYAFDHPDNWQIRVRALSRDLRLREEETRQILSELIEKGVAVPRQDRYGVYYDIYAFPPDAAPKPIPSGPLQASAAPCAETTANADPAAPKPGEPMSDERRAYWLKTIRNLFPEAARAHDLNRAIRDD